MKRWTLIALLACISCFGPTLPVDTVLWHAEEFKMARTDPPVRRAPAAFMSFRRTHEYIKHMTYVMEHPDNTIYFAGNSQHVVIIGKWERKWRTVKVKPEIVWRTTPPQGRDPMCDQQLVFHVVANDRVSGTEGDFTPINNLVAPDYESYVNDARRKGFICNPEPPK